MEDEWLIMEDARFDSEDVEFDLKGVQHPLRKGLKRYPLDSDARFSNIQIFLRLE